MALTADATVGGPAANSYASLEAANTALGFRVGAAAWADLDPDDQVQALVTAAREIDTLRDRFVGSPATSTQALEWPRTGTRYGADVLPRPLVDAAIELAFSYVPAFADGATADALNPTPSNIKEETVGPITTVFFDPGTPAATELASFPAAVQRLLNGLLRSTTAQWGTGTAVRTS